MKIPKKERPIETIFKVLLFILLLISFYMFIVNIFFHTTNQHDQKYKAFTAWQFPMLFAIFLDSYFMSVY